MPNWCQNRLKITAPSEEALDKALSVLTNDEGHLDYNTLTPMPPEIDPEQVGCNLTNSLAKKAYHDIYNEGVAADSDHGHDEESVKQAHLIHQAKEATGYANWYDWCLANWGTKWNASGAELKPTLLGDDVLEVEWSSPWGMPVYWLEALIEAIPESEIEVFAEEHAMGWWAEVFSDAGVATYDYFEGEISYPEGRRKRMWRTRSDLRGA